MRFKLLNAFLIAGSMLYAQSKPGGIATNASLWLRADKGITTNESGNVTNWTDQTGKNTSITSGFASTTTNARVNIIENSYNFNPVARFDYGAYFKSSDRRYYSDIFSIVRFNRTASSGTVIGFDDNDATNNTWKYFLNHTGANIYTHDGTATGSASTFSWFAPDADQITKQYNLYATSYGAPKDFHLLNGRNYNATEKNASQRSKIYATAYIGARFTQSSGALGVYLDGEIGEIIAFEEALSLEDRTKVQSYLGIKYGLTVEYQEDAGIPYPNVPKLYTRYVLSDNTVIWDGAHNDYADYNYFVTAIAKDEAFGLSQIKSKGIGSNLYSNLSTGDCKGILTLVHGANFSSPQPFANDKEYCIIASNNAEGNKLLSYSYQIDENNKCALITRQNWKVNASLTSTVSLQFDIHESMISQLNVTNCGIVILRNGNIIECAGVYDNTSKSVTVNNISLQTGDIIYLKYNDGLTDMELDINATVMAVEAEGGKTTITASIINGGTQNKFAYAINSQNFGEFVSESSFSREFLAEELTPGLNYIYIKAISDDATCVKSKEVIGHITINKITALPGGVNGANLWLKAGEGVVKDNQNNVSGWLDLTGNNEFQVVNNPSTVGEIAPPVWKEGLANGNPVISFNGTSAFEGLNSKKFQCMFCVHQARPTSNGFRSSAISFKEDGLNGYNANWNMTFFYTTFYGTGNYMYVQDGITVWTSSDLRVVGKVYDYSSWFGAFGYNPDLVTVNGGAHLVANNRFEARTLSGKPYVGVTYALGKNPSLVDFLDGEIAEIIAFDRKLTDTERFQIESYLAMKYGLTECKYEAGNKTATFNNADRYAFDYVLSDGTVAWPGSDATYKPYSQYMAAIAKDTKAGLEQNRSTGRHGYMLDIEDGILSLANGSSFDAPQSIATDKQYVFMGSTANKIDETEFLQGIDNSEITYSVLKRHWMVKTEGISTISIQVKLNARLLEIADTDNLCLFRKRGNEYTKCLGSYDTATKTFTGNNIEIATGDLFYFAIDAVDKAKVTTPEQTVCTSSLPIALTATIPGGVWSGTNVNGSTFNPAGLTPGDYIITYTYGGRESSVVITVINEETEPTFGLSSSVIDVDDNYQAIVITGTCNFIDNSIEYEFTIDDPLFETPMQEYSTSNVFRIAGYLLTDGEHLISARMRTGGSSSHPCMKETIRTATIVLNKTNGKLQIKGNKNEINIYPVPVEKELVVSGLPLNKEVSIIISDNLGRTLVTQESAGWEDTAILQVGHLDKGTLFITIIEKATGNKVFGQQIFK